MKRLILLGFLLTGCAAPGKDIAFSEGDFALVEFGLRDCTSNSEHLGLEKMLTRLFGTTPQIDLDRQVARVRLAEPTGIDLSRVEDGFRRSNTGLGGIWITARGTPREGWFVLSSTGQRFRLSISAADEPEPRWRTIRLRLTRAERGEPKID